MSERWFVTHIFLRQDAYAQKDKVLLEAIKPIVDMLENEKLIDNFHFLFEPKFEILFRIKLRTDANIGRIKSIIEQQLPKIKELCVETKFEDNYIGEESSYGQEGWLYAQNFLDIGSRITLLTREIIHGRKSLTAGRVDSQFSEGKFVHLLLNQYGFNMLKESQWHSVVAIERMIMAMKIPSRLDQLEKTIKELKEDLNSRSS